MEYDEMNEEEMQKEVFKAENRYEDLKDRVHYQYEEIQQLKEEIERLKGVYKKNLELVDKMYVKDKEIERLNNIINELEKKLLELRLTDVDGKTIVYRLLDKLQELKGDGSNGK